MKANELMVGDWYYWEAEGKKYPMQVTKDTFTLSDEDISNFQPIPLTPEILKKNFEELYCENGIYIYSGIDGRVIIQNHYNIKGWDWTLDYNCQTGTATAFGRICYVHELQHVLKNNHIDIQIKV